MIIETTSARLAWTARLARLLPPGVSGVCLRMYPLKRALAERPRFTVKSSLSDVRLRCERVEHVALCFAIRGFFDWGNAVIANTLCRPGDAIIEVGANIGTESLHFSRIVGPSGRVLCFEPLPANVATLREQLALNGITNVEVREAAVSDAPGRMRFERPDSDRNSGQGRLAAEAGDSSTIEIEAVTLDGLLDEGRIPSPRLIAMDVQGAELFVLRGARRLIEERRPALILEVEEESLAAYGFCPAQIIDFLRDVGYAVWRINKWGLGPADASKAKQGNWLALPNRADEDAGGRAGRVAGRLFRAAALPLIPGLNPAVIRGHRDSAAAVAR